MLMCWPSMAKAEESADAMMLPFDVTESISSSYDNPSSEGDLSSMKKLMAEEPVIKNVSSQARVLPASGFVPEDEPLEFMGGLSLCPNCTVKVERQPTYIEEMIRADLALDELKQVDLLIAEKKKNIALPVVDSSATESTDKMVQESATSDSPSVGEEELWEDSTATPEKQALPVGESEPSSDESNVSGLDVSL